ncbi:hypothetical protein BSKO_13558 [Bryopsis sp. KO-2023]|nr:hypothetical protein BSKO_13558 [Bryopsis sp. KO-2023]
MRCEGCMGSFPLRSVGIVRGKKLKGFVATMAEQTRGYASAEVGTDTNGSHPLSRLNRNVASLQPSKTGFMADLAMTLKEEGKDIISLAAGEPDFDTPEPVSSAGIEAIKMGLTRYTKMTGTTELKQAISKKLKDENGLEYGVDSIVVSNGAKQSVWQALMATCGEGDEVLIPAPFWVSYPEMARLAGAIPKVLETTAKTGYILTPQYLESALTPKSRLLVLCSPSNPTGAVYTRAELEALAEVVRKHPQLMVLADEIYEYIIYPPAQHHSFAALPGMFDRTITVNGFSKGFAMTGWRMGYAAAPVHFATAMASIQSHCTSGPSSISQHAALAALSMGPRGGEPVGKMVKEFHKRRDMVISKLQDIEGVEVETPGGAFYALPDVSAFFGEGVSAEKFGPIPDGDALCRYIIQKAEVALVPGSAFGSPQTLRMSYATSMEKLEEALSRISKALEAIKKSPPGAQQI